MSNFIGRLLRYLRLLEMTLVVKDIYWAKRLLAQSISASEVQYNRKTRRLLLKRLNISIGKQQNLFLLESYPWALQLVDALNARFYLNERDELFIDVAGLGASVQRTEEIWMLKELLVEGSYNMRFSRPTVVWDIGMNVGLAAIYFASQPDVVVVGFEPFKKTYNRALRNIALNPKISQRIKAYNIGASDSKSKVTAEYNPLIAGQLGLFGPRPDNMDGLNFETEEIELDDAGEILDSIVATYPGRDLIGKIDCEGSEYQIIKKLHETGRLKLIDSIMLEWHRRIPAHDPSTIAKQLCDSGFRVFQLTPYDRVGGMLYAVRADSHNSNQSQR